MKINNIKKFKEFIWGLLRDRFENSGYSCHEDIDEKIALIGKGIIDSFGFVEFVTFIEDEFEINFEDGEIDEDNFENLVVISKYILKKLSKK